MLERCGSWDELRARFAWDVPARLNIGAGICERWAGEEPKRAAIIEVGEDGHAEVHDHAALKARSDAIAGALAARGVTRGDRVAVLLPQSLDAAAAHLAVLRMGAISLPLFTLFGPEALAHRLRHSGACAAIADAEGAARIAVLRDELPDLRHLLCAEGPGPGAEDVIRHQ